MDLHPDFHDLLAEFADENVKFLVIGGYAVGYYDRPRYTKDMDLWLDATSENLAAVHRALTAFGAPEHVVKALRTARRDEVVWLGNPPLRMDFLQEIPGLSFAEAWPRRVLVPWGGTTVPVIGLEDLIASKRAAGREQDLADVRNLEKVASARQRS